MNRYDVQSGRIRKIIFAADPQAAALWLMNNFMETVFPDTVQPEFDSDPFEMLEDGLMLLADQVQVSSLSLDDDTVEWFDTLEIFTEWNELVLAVSRMDRVLSRPGAAELCPVDQ